jgi:methionyl-tRNA formyltransferase
MRIVFFGSSQFALPSLKAIVDTQHRILAVVTPPDRRAGRGLKLRPTTVKEFSIKKGLFLLQPENPNKDEVFIEKLKSFKADVFVVVSYGFILGKHILDIPGFFAINLHPSLLPKYRGAAPINWAIINGEKKTGISVIKMTEKMDGGPIIYQSEEEISTYDTSLSLGIRLSQKGAQALVETLSLIEKNKVNLRPQEEEKASFAPKLKKEDAHIDFNLPAWDLHNKVRGMLDWPVAFTFLKDKRIELLETDFEKEKIDYLPSKIIDIGRNHIKVSTGKGILIIKKLKPEGKKEMSASDFARGYRLKKGDNFG